MRFTRGHYGIYVPITRDIIAPPLTIGIKGRYKVELIDASTEKVKRKLEFDNLLTNVGLDLLFTATQNLFTDINYCGVGTGNTTPANTDIALVAEILPRENNNAGIGDAATYQAGPPDFLKVTRVRQFATTEANGNLTEIGFFSAATGSTMFSRQLIKDGLGNPTTLVKTSSDLLRITYEIDIYPPQSDNVQLAQNISGTNYDITGRAQNVNQADWGFQFVNAINGLMDTPTTAAPSRYTLGTNGLGTRTGFTSISGLSSATSKSLAAYTNGSFSRDQTVIWNTTAGNGTWAKVNMPSPNSDGGAIYSWGLSPSLVKNNTQQLTWNFNVSCVRH